MWKRAVDREKKEAEFLKIAENTNAIAGSDQIQESPDPEALEKKSHEFQKILEVPREERDRVQRMQVIDRAAAAIAAARALLKDNPPPTKVVSSSSTRTAGSADNFRPQSPDGGTFLGYIFRPRVNFVHFFDNHDAIEPVWLRKMSDCLLADARKYGEETDSDSNFHYLIYKYDYEMIFCSSLLEWDYTPEQRTRCH